MQETRIENRVSRIAIDKLVAHPDNPNRMSKAKFAKLVRNIEQTGRYEPLVVRPCPQKNCHSCGNRNPDDDGISCFQIINGHHRWQALRELGYKTAEAIVWDIDDHDTDILLATLNRLGGSDILEKKLALLKRLNQRMEVGKLAKLLPQTAKQIERLTLILDTRPSNAGFRSKPAVGGSIPDEYRASRSKYRALVFFVNDKQQEIVQRALSLAGRDGSDFGELSRAGTATTKAAKRAAALTYIAQQFLNLKLEIKPRNNY